MNTDTRPTERNHPSQIPEKTGHETKDVPIDAIRTGERLLKLKESTVKELMESIRHQDPLSPMDDTAFIAQMASFSELEMMSKLNKNFAEFTNLQQFQSAQGYIGKNVTLFVDGEDLSGLATGIEQDDGTTRVFVNGAGYNIDLVYKVEQPEG